MLSPLNKTKVRDYSNFNAGKFMTDLCEVDWNNTCHSNDVNKSFSRFYKNINRLINKHATLNSKVQVQKFLLAFCLSLGPVVITLGSGGPLFQDLSLLHPVVVVAC